MTYNNRYGLATAAVAAFSVAVALLSQVKERFSPTAKLVIERGSSPSDIIAGAQIVTRNNDVGLKMNSDHSVMLGMSAGKGPVYMNIILPRDEFYWSPTPDPCGQHHVRIDTWWLKNVPDKCVDGYEEAGLYTSTTGVRLTENKFLERALRRRGWYTPSSLLHKNRDLFTFIKLRACVPEGSACYPNGELFIDTSVYYNIVAKDHGLLGVDNIGKEMSWTKSYMAKSATVTYNAGPFYPDHEYVFKPEDKRHEERNQWRFEEANDGAGSYLLINRWTGQFMGYGYKKHNGASDKVGRSKLYKSDAIKVSVGTDCDEEGTVTLEAIDLGSFKKGMTSTLFFTANNPHPGYYQYKTSCSWNASCKDGWRTHSTSSSGCFFLEWNDCRKDRPKPSPANTNDLKFQLREVTLHIEPQVSHKPGTVKPVQVNSDTSMSLNEIALQSIAPKFQVERGRDLVEAAMNFHFDNPDWRPFSRYRPKNIPKGFGAVIAASRFKGSVGKPFVASSKIRRSLKFASLGGPALAIFTGFLSAYLDKIAAEATEKRFQGIEKRLEDIIEYIETVHKEAQWTVIKEKYDELFKSTFINYQRNSANLRPPAFIDLQNKSFMKTWIATLDSMKQLYEGHLPLKINFALAEEEVADHIMSFYPSVVISYIQLIEEIVSLEVAVVKEKQNYTCDYIVNYQFGSAIKVKDLMKAEALKLTTIVEIIRAEETDLSDANDTATVVHTFVCPTPQRPLSSPNSAPPSIDNTLEDENIGVTLETSTVEDAESGSVAVPPSSAPLDSNVLIENGTVAMRSIDDDSDVQIQQCPPPIYHTLYFDYKQLKEHETLLLKVKAFEHSIYNQVQKLRRDEIKWTFRNFGKYSIQGLYDAVDGARASIIDTCNELRDNETYANEYIEYGKDAPLAALDEVKHECTW